MLWVKSAKYSTRVDVFRSFTGIGLYRAREQIERFFDNINVGAA